MDSRRLSAALRKARSRNGEGLREAARAMRISAPYLRGLELGLPKHRNPSLDIVRRIMEHYGLSWEDLQ